MKNTSNSGNISELDQILLRLGEAAARGRLTPEGGLAIFSPRNRYAKAVLNVNPKICALLMREGLVQCCGTQGDDWVLSTLGRARLRRASAADSPFRSQHQVLDLREARAPDGALRVVRVNNGESPLGWLFSHKDRTGKPLINEHQFAAGERLRRDFTLANLSPHVTAMWGMPINHAGRSGDSDAASMNDTMIAAKDRLWAALDALGPDLGGVLLQVCCHLNGLAEAERQLGWPARSGKVVLGIALDRLAVHYGINLATGMPKNQLRPGHPGVAHKGNKTNLHNTQKNSC